MATNTTYHPAGILTRLAHWLGRTWARGWNKAGEALASTGLPPKAIEALTWIAKIAIAGVLLYVAFWVVLLVVFVILVLNMAAHRGGGDTDYTVPESDVFEVRDGHSGIGLYDNSLDIRIG
jgi:fatty acid desaturase